MDTSRKLTDDEIKDLVTRMRPTAAEVATLRRLSVDSAPQSLHDEADVSDSVPEESKDG